MQWLIIIGIGLIWLIVKIFESISDSATAYQNSKKLKEEREEKYGGRTIDASKTLFERNADIIEQFADKIRLNNSYSRHSYYYLDNETRDCINELCTAENRYDIMPGSSYLSSWRSSAPAEWVKLAEQIESKFKKKQAELQDAIQQKEREKRVREENANQLEREIRKVKKDFDYRKSKRVEPSSLRKITQRKERGDIDIEDIEKILTPEKDTWTNQETGFISLQEPPKHFPLFEGGGKSASAFGLNEEIKSFNSLLDADQKVLEENKKFFTKIKSGYKKAEKESVVERINYIIDNLTFPSSAPKIWDVDFDPEQGIALVEVKLPDVVHNQIYKTIQLKNGKSKKPLNQKEAREEIPKIHPAIILRFAYEIFRNDNADIIKLLVLNGWVEFDDPTTGNIKKTYTASLAVEKSKVVALNLEKLDPLSAFSNLSGKSAGKLIDIVPVTPMMTLDRKDKRFIATKEVLGQLSTQTNLASMDWQDFENLIAELFQKEFSEEGTEIKLTQSSRDKGVDAVVFNPDPIRGGKYVIQAKRYTNTVDVSAVRDLVAVVAHEGASRGILVTTSTFGADAYAFVQGKPITLLDGAKLLGLLEKHGYKFRINLAEARKLNMEENGKK